MNKVVLATAILLALQTVPLQSAICSSSDVDPEKSAMAAGLSAEDFKIVQDAVHVVGSWSYGEGKNRAGIATMDTHLKTDPKDHISLLARALLKSSVGDKQGADQDMVLLTKLLPKSQAPLIARIVMAQQFDGDPAAGIVAATKLYEITKSKKFIRTRGRLYARMGDLKNATADLTDGLSKSDSDACDNYIVLYQAQMKAEKWIDAEKIAEILIEILPDSYYYAECLAEAAEKAGHNEKAIASYEKAAKLESEPKVNAKKFLEKAAALKSGAGKTAGQ